MAVYWLTPVTVSGGESIALGEGRVRCPDGEELASFRSRMQQAHPRLLMMFKAGMLEEDEEAGSCIAERPGFSLARGDTLQFGGESAMRLTSCAAAFFDRLPLPGEAAGWLAPLLSESWSPVQRDWIERMNQWAEQGKSWMLIKEESGE